VSGGARPRVSLLLPNKDNARVLDLVLDRLARNTTYEDVELVAVDDGSTDGSQELLRRWRDSGRFREMHVIEREHSGVVATLNAGLAAATGELVVQLDADASVETPDWVQKLVAFFTSDERIGLVTAKVVTDSRMLNACGVDVIGPEGLHDRPTHITEPVGRRRWHARVLRVTEGRAPGIEDRVAEVDTGIGCCMMYRREDALAVGGYDTGFSPVWFDDLDLGLSLRRLGRKAFFLPDVRVIHWLRLRTGAPPPSPSRRQAARLQREVLDRLPVAARIRLRGLRGQDEPSPAHQTRLDHHYAYWREKWGWDLLNPDLAALRERWAGTELLWAYDDDRRAAGREIVAAWEARAAAAR
jgi:GT2 family glycosyltransferase